MLDVENREQHVYFIILPGWKEMPTVIGQHIFDHQFEWEGEAPWAGDAASLVE